MSYGFASAETGDDPEKKEQSVSVEPAPAPEKRSSARPDHIFEASFNRFGNGESGYRAMLRDKVFTVGEMPFSNMIIFDRRKSTGRNAPDEPLYSISTAIAGQSADSMVFLRFGSNSDKPFEDSSTLSIAAVGARRFYSSGNHSFFAAVYITRERYFNCKYPFPIPFISYTYKSDDLTVSLGVPTRVMWRITPRFSFTAMYTPVRNVETSIAFRPVPFVTISAEGIWRVEGYYMSKRTHNDDKLYHESGTARLKVQGYTGAHTGFHIAEGYRFLDLYFTSDSSTHRKHSRHCSNSFFTEFGFSVFM
jgi:hypothetical protein